MNPYKKIVSDFVRLVKRIKTGPPVVGLKPRRRQASATARALIFSPHPDDECIVGGLALRLQREAGVQVVNVAVTLGSKKQRQAARLRELKQACGYLGFDLAVAGRADLIAAILKQSRPAVIFVPHAGDGHATHVRTHHLLMNALKRMPADFQCCVVETEYWGQMTEPNLLVEIGVNELADLMAALSLHKGEVKRNAYHARLPAWMMDNVRRAELLLGAGISAPDFTFGTIYRLRLWKRRRLVEAWSGGKVLPSQANLAALLR